LTLHLGGVSASWRKRGHRRRPRQGTAGGGASGRGAWCDPRHSEDGARGRRMADSGLHAPVEQL